jgi:hypothetical protein
LLAGMLAAIPELASSAGAFPTSGPGWDAPAGFLLSPAGRALIGSRSALGLARATARAAARPQLLPESRPVAPLTAQNRLALENAFSLWLTDVGYPELQAMLSEVMLRPEQLNDALVQ